MRRKRRRGQEVRIAARAGVGNARADSNIEVSS